MSYKKQNFTNGQVLTAAHMNHIEEGIGDLETQVTEAKTYTNAQVKKAAPRNLLDNSDFRNAVNQRGFVSGTKLKMLENFIDRWRAPDTTPTVTINENGISTDTWIEQLLPETMDGKTITVAIGLANGTVSCNSAKVVVTDGWNESAVVNIDGSIAVLINGRKFYLVGTNIAWAALYEGEYTLDTLPEYQPKGYGAELAECQRYYCNSWFGVGKSAQNQILGSPWNPDSADFPIYFPRTMAGTPKVTYYGSFDRDVPKIFSGGAYQDCGNIATNHRLGLHGTYARVTKSGADTSTWTIGSIIQFHAHWEAEVPM